VQSERKGKIIDSPKGDGNDIYLCVAVVVYCVRLLILRKETETDQLIMCALPEDRKIIDSPKGDGNVASIVYVYPYLPSKIIDSPKGDGNG